MHNYTVYFKNKKGFERLINKMYEKYRSLSKISGTIKLNNITNVEAIELSSFFGENFKENDNITISIKKFITIMNNTKFDDFSPEILLEEYLGIKLITKKEEQKNIKSKELKVYEDLIYNTKDPAKSWITYTIESETGAYPIFKKMYNRNELIFKNCIINVANLLNNLPKQKELLPIFASKITNDPHYLDFDTPQNTIFMYGLSYYNNSKFPISRKKKIELLSKYKIEIDNFSNNIITYNLLSSRSGIVDFQNESLILNIQNILNTKDFSAINNKVYIIENPSILSEIISKKINKTLIISSGFPNTSLYLLIDKLLLSETKLYYSGDLDPEGLIIAQKLKQKYKNKITLFCYTSEDYEQGISEKQVSPKRLSILKNIVEKELQDAKTKLLLKKLASYQENNRERIIEYIERS